MIYYLGLSTSSEPFVSLRAIPHTHTPFPSGTPARFVLVTKSLDMVDSRALLEREGLVHVLALLYQGAHMEREALSVWRDLGTGVHSEPGYDGVKDTVAFLSASNNKVPTGTTLGRASLFSCFLSCHSI